MFTKYQFNLKIMKFNCNNCSVQILGSEEEIGIGGIFSFFLARWFAPDRGVDVEIMRTLQKRHLNREKITHCFPRQVNKQSCVPVFFQFKPSFLWQLTVYMKYLIMSDLHSKNRKTVVNKLHSIIIESVTYWSLICNIVYLREERTTLLVETFLEVFFFTWVSGTMDCYQYQVVASEEVVSMLSVM